MNRYFLTNGRNSAPGGNCAIVTTDPTSCNNNVCANGATNWPHCDAGGSPSPGSSQSCESHNNVPYCYVSASVPARNMWTQDGYKLLTAESTFFTMTDAGCSGQLQSCHDWMATAHRLDRHHQGRILRNHHMLFAS